ncbi:MAG: tetratricopeptide repeat protein [Terriglobales bacterium]
MWNSLITPCPALRVGFALGLLGWGGLIAAQAAPDPDYVRGLQLQQSGHADSALAAYQRVLERQPDNVAALSNMGAALAELGRYAEAVATDQRALALLPENPGIRLNLALAYYKGAQTAAAITTLKPLLSRVPTSAPQYKTIVLLLADCYSRLDQNQNVIQLLTPLEGAYGADHGFLYLLGSALIRDGRAAAGSQLVDRILRDGDSAEAHLMLGTAAVRAQDFPRAVQEFKQAVQLSPQLAEAHRMYGQALLDTGSSDAARGEFQKALALDGNDYEATLLLGVILRQHYDYAGALTYLQRALTLRPGAPDARFQIGATELALGNFAAARHVLEALVHDDPDFLEAHVSLATVYFKQHLKAEGERERDIIARLNVAAQQRAIQERQRADAVSHPVASTPAKPGSS